MGLTKIRKPAACFFFLCSEVHKCVSVALNIVGIYSVVSEKVGVDAYLISRLLRSGSPASERH